MLLHGEAVSVDMALSAELAYGRGLLSPQERLRVLGVMVGLRLPLWHEAGNLDLLMKVGVYSLFYLDWDAAIGCCKMQSSQCLHVTLSAQPVRQHGGVSPASLSKLAASLSHTPVDKHVMLRWFL
jgi:hypothetical protein